MPERVHDLEHGDDLLSQLLHLHERASAILTRAEDSGDLRAAIAAIREVRGCLEFGSKLTGQIAEQHFHLHGHQQLGLLLTRRRASTTRPEHRGSRGWPRYRTSSAAGTSRRSTPASEGPCLPRTSPTRTQILVVLTGLRKPRVKSPPVSFGSSHSRIAAIRCAGDVNLAGQLLRTSGARILYAAVSQRAG